MKAVIIGAAAVAAAGVNGEAAPKRALQDVTIGDSGMVTGWTTGGPAPKYWFDFSNPATCVDQGKTVMGFDGKSKLHLKGGRPGFVCNQGWRDDNYAYPAAVLTAATTKVTPAPGYAVNYTGPAMASGGNVAGAAAAWACPAADGTNNFVSGYCSASGQSLTGLLCKAGYAITTGVNAAGVVTASTAHGMSTTQLASVASGATGQAGAISAVGDVKCVPINECSTSQTVTLAKHQCNDYATCTDGPSGAGYKCACNTYETNYQTTKDGAGAVAIGKQSAWDNNAACSALSGTGVGIYDWSAGIGGTPGLCNGLKGQTQKITGTGMPERVFGTFETTVYTSSVSGEGNDVFYNSNAGMTSLTNSFSSEGVSNGMYSSGFKSHLGCGIQACERLFTDNNVNNEVGAHWYNHSNWTNVTYADNCTADSLDYTGPSMNCTNGTTGENRPNCSDGHWNGSTAQHGGATQARQLGEVAHVGAGRKLFEARRLQANNDTNTSSAAAGASPTAAALPPNVSVTLAPPHAFFRGSGVAGTDRKAKDVFNILHFDGIQDYAEMEAGDMTAGHAIGAANYRGSPYMTAAQRTAAAAAYGRYPTSSNADGTAKDMIEGADGADSQATFMFTFATTSTAMMGLMEGYGTEDGRSTNNQYGTMDFANISTTDFLEVNKMMNDLVQISLDNKRVSMRAFGYATQNAPNAHPLTSSINFVNYRTSADAYTVAPSPVPSTAAGLANYVTLFVTTGGATTATMGAVHTANSGAAAAAVAGKNCNYPKKVCELEEPMYNGSYTGEARRLTESPAVKKFQAALRKLAVLTLNADDSTTCDPVNQLTGAATVTGSDGIPPIRRAQRLYALGRQQFTPDISETKEAAFGACLGGCCCSTYQNASAAGACGSGATKGNPDKLNLQHFKYFSGNMRNFGVWNKALTAAEMHTIMTNLDMAVSGDAPTSSSTADSSTDGANDEYWHVCRTGIVNETDPCLAGNASHTLAERFALSTDADCANTTECAEHSNSFQPVWNRNPAGASVTCNIDQLKFSMKFKVNVSSAADIAACIAAGTCVDDAGAAVKIPTLGGLTALPGGSEFGFNMTVELGEALATGIKYVLMEAENDAEGCTLAPATALLDADPTDAVKETKTVSAASGACPKKFHFNSAANTGFTYAYKNNWHFEHLMNETDGLAEYGLSIDSFDTVSTTTETHLDEAERGEDNVASAAQLLTAINSTTGEVELKFNRKLTFTMKGVTDNVADVIMESLEDEYYSDLISPVLHYLKHVAFTSTSTLPAAYQVDLTTGAGLELYTAVGSESNIFNNVNMTLAAGACTVTDSYGVVRGPNGPDGSTSTSTSDSQTGSPGTSTDDDGTTTTTAAKKKSSNAFRATGVSALASVFALIFAVFFSRQ
jgi:hypothetical protein